MVWEHDCLSSSTQSKLPLSANLYGDSQWNGYFLSDGVESLHTVHRFKCWHLSDTHGSSCLLVVWASPSLSKLGPKVNHYEVALCVLGQVDNYNASIAKIVLTYFPATELQKSSRNFENMLPMLKISQLRASACLTTIPIAAICGIYMWLECFFFLVVCPLSIILDVKYKCIILKEK